MDFQKNKQSKLKYGIIEVTTACQNRCPGCYMISKNELGNKQMTLEQATHILDMCKNYLGKELQTMDILGGEPFLWPHLQNYIEILLNRNIKPCIFTNMLSINPKTAKWLFERQIPITGKLNINPDDKSQYELQAKLIGNSQNAVKKMLNAINTIHETGYRSPLFKLENLIRKENIKYVPEYYEWCLQHGIDPDIELVGSSKLIDEEYWELYPKPQEIAQIIPQIQEIRKKFGLNSEIIMPHIFGPCKFYKNGLYFASNGTIRACSNSPITLSNIKDPKPIDKAWNSTLLINRRILSDKLVSEPCSNCSKWDKCMGGCRATCEASGNPFSGYLLCPVPYIKLKIN